MNARSPHHHNNLHHHHHHHHDNHYHVGTAQPMLRQASRQALQLAPSSMDPPHLLQQAQDAVTLPLSTRHAQQGVPVDHQALQLLQVTRQQQLPEALQTLRRQLCASAAAATTPAELAKGSHNCILLW